MYMTSNIYTNAVDLAKKVNDLKEKNKDFTLEIVKGIDGEDVVKLSWNYISDEDDEES